MHNLASLKVSAIGHRTLKLLACAVVVIALSVLAIAASPASAATNDVKNFGPNLQATCPNPEGIAVDLKGNLYAAAFNAQPGPNGGSNICVENNQGQLTGTIPVPPPPGGNNVSLLGELFEPGHGLYVVDFGNAFLGAAGNGRLLKVDPNTHAITQLNRDPLIGPNGIAQDKSRNLFVSDSFAGNIRKIAPDGSSDTVWKADPLLQAIGNPNSPPFGANGVQFDLGQHFLYVANTNRDQIERVKVNPDGSAGPVETFADGAAIDAAQHTTQALHGADGIAFDFTGNLYVDANQANEIQVLSPDGKLIARHAGTGNNALDFPASLVFYGNKLFSTNLSLFDGGVNSKLSEVDTPFPGVPVFAPF
jgi:sugar lactone lactonase YvrE